VDETSERNIHRVVIVAYDGVQSLDVSGPAEVLAGANGLLAHQAADHRRYDVTVVSLGGGPVTTESAISLVSEPIADLAPGPLGTVIVPGGFAVFDHAESPEMVVALAGLIARSDRLVTVCSGAYLAAATGALDGRTVTTHWARADRLASDFPTVKVDPDPIYIHCPEPDPIRDRTGDPTREPTREPTRYLDVWSSAGVTAGIDLCLALVEDDHGTELAQTVARWLVMYLRRPGGQSQFAAPTWIRQAPAGPIRQAQELVIANPGDDHRVGSLAARVAMSERHFVRRFTAEVGLPPARFVARVRVDAARHELERSDDTVAAIATRCGFGTAETLRRSLQRHLGVSPERYRQRFSHAVEQSEPTLERENIRP
jgi:transcriptional regulator GlxA family with amidase domain